MLRTLVIVVYTVGGFLLGIALAGPVNQIVFPPLAEVLYAFLPDGPTYGGVRVVSGLIFLAVYLVIGVGIPVLLVRYGPLPTK